MKSAKWFDFAVINGIQVFTIIFFSGASWFICANKLRLYYATASLIAALLVLTFIALLNSPIVISIAMKQKKIAMMRFSCQMKKCQLLINRLFPGKYLFLLIFAINGPLVMVAEESRYLSMFVYSVTGLLMGFRFVPRISHQINKLRVAIDGAKEAIRLWDIQKQPIHTGNCSIQYVSCHKDCHMIWHYGSLRKNCMNQGRR